MKSEGLVFFDAWQSFKIGFDELARLGAGAELFGEAETRHTISDGVVGHFGEAALFCVHFARRNPKQRGDGARVIW